MAGQQEDAYWRALCCNWARQQVPALLCTVKEIVREKAHATYT